MNWVLCEVTWKLTWELGRVTGNRCPWCFLEGSGNKPCLVLLFTAAFGPSRGWMVCFVCVLQCVVRNLLGDGVGCQWRSVSKGLGAPVRHGCGGWVFGCFAPGRNAKRWSLWVAGGTLAWGEQVRVTDKGAELLNFILVTNSLGDCMGSPYRSKEKSVRGTVASNNPFCAFQFKIKCCRFPGEAASLGDVWGFGQLWGSRMFLL